MSDLIRVKRGLKADLPELMQGEFGFCTDTQELFIGGVNGNVAVKKREFSVMDFGAKGNGIADDTLAIQATIDAAALVKAVVRIPAGTYKITQPLYAIDVTIIGEGAGMSLLYTENNIPMIVIDTDVKQSYYKTYSGLGFIGNVSGDRTLNNGIEIRGTAAKKNYFNFNTFENLTFLGTYRSIHSKKTTGQPENALNWNMFTQIKTTNYGANPVNHGIKFDYGSGTGNVFDACNIVATVSGLEWGGSGNENIGDITISDIQFGGGGSGIKAVKGATAYGSNIIITGCQWDAGVQYGIDFTRMSGFRVQGCNWGGATTHRIKDCTYYSLEAALKMDSTYGVQKGNIGPGATADLFSFVFPAGLRQSYKVEITTFGYMQGVDTRIVTSKFFVYWNGVSASWTLVSENGTGSGSTLMSHIATDGATPKIGVKTVGTNNDSNVDSQMTIIGSNYEVNVM